MATPTTWSPVTPSGLTGNALVDALIGGTQWQNPALTYSFPNYSAYWSTDPVTGYGPQGSNAEPWVTGYESLFQGDIDAVKSALATWARLSGLTFREVADNATVVGDLRFAYASDLVLGGAQAWAYFPADAAASGDVWFNAGGTSYVEPWTKGSYEYMTAIHEIGHALGLKHPFETSPQNATTLAPAWDTRSFTLMSYAADPGDQNTYFSYEPTTPMLLDVAAIQTLYGINTRYHSGQDTYTFSGTGNYHMTLWDAGGVDTVTYNASGNGLIDLRAGYGSKLGKPVYVEDASGHRLYSVPNIWVAYGTVLENAKGGSGNDTIFGNGVRNILDGGAGADQLRGGAGNDVLKGGVGNDKLYGGSGKDHLTGGGGADRFVFDTKLNATSNVDTITDYDAGGVADRIGLDDDIFRALGVAGTTAGASLAVSRFHQGAAAHDASDRVIYDASTGALYYDPDGTGQAAQVKLAILGTSAHPTLNAGDFLVLA